MSERPTDPGALRAHASACDACRISPPALEGIETILASGAVRVDAEMLSRRVVARLQPELTRRAREEYWRQVAVAVLIGLVPLPAVALYNAYVLRLAYQLIATVLPAGLAGYLIATYVAFLVLLFAVTYAAVPVLIGRQGRFGTAQPT